MRDLKDRYPTCPICGQECETLYYDKKHADVVGCDECLETRDAWDYLEDEIANELADIGDMQFEMAREAAWGL